MARSRSLPLFALAVTAALTPLALAGCAPADPGAGEIQQWLAEPEHAEASDALAVLSAVAEAGRPEDGAGRVAVAFPTPQRISTIVFSCSGDGSMRLGLLTQTASTYIGHASDPLECASGPHTIPAEELGVTSPVDGISAVGFDADRRGAWSAAIVDSDD